MGNIFCTKTVIGLTGTGGRLQQSRVDSLFQRGICKCSSNWLSGKKVYITRDLQYSPRKSGYLPFKNLKTCPRLRVSGYSPTRPFQEVGSTAPCLGLGRYELHYPEGTEPQESGTSVLEDGVWAGLPAWTAGDGL